MAEAVYSFRDRSNEISSVRIRLTSLAQENNVRTDLDAVSIAELARVTRIDDVVRVSDNTPNNPFAQRELGLRIHFRDNVTQKIGFITVPAPDLTNLTLNDDVVTLLDGSIMEALHDQLNSDMLSEAGNAVTVIRATVVGRNT